MNLLDIILIAIIAISVVTAASKGFVYEIWMMAAAVAALVIALWQYPAVAAWLGWITIAPAEEIRNFVAFIVVLLAALLAAMVAGRLLRGAVRAVGLEKFDRLLGAGLGLVRGLLLAAVVVVMMTVWPFNFGLLRGSALAPRFLWGGRALARTLPAELELRFQAGLEHIGLPPAARLQKVLP
ncbi:MAG: CvpA family protein [Terriglobales bacterium]